MNKIVPLTLALSVGLTAGLLAAPPPPDGPDGQIKALRHQIAAKMLFDGLALSGEQQSQLRDLRDRMEATRREMAEQRQGRQDELAALLVRARDEIYDLGTISDATRQRLQETRRGSEQSDRGARPQVRDEIQKILSPEQLEYLRRFDPSRELGLNRDRDQHRRGSGLAERIRSLSDEEFAERKRQILDRQRTRLQQQGSPDPDATLAKLERQLDTLRQGSPEDLTRLRGELPPDLLGRARARGRRDRHRRHEMGRILLSPEFGSLLDGRDPRQSS